MNLSEVNNETLIRRTITEHGNDIKAALNKLRELGLVGGATPAELPGVFHRHLTESEVVNDSELASTLFILLGAALKQVKEPLVVFVASTKSCDFSLQTSFVVTEDDGENTKGFVVVNLTDAA